MENIRHILIPVDFSEEGQYLPEYGLKLAIRSGAAKVVVLYSYQVPVTNYGDITTIPATHMPDQVLIMEEIQKSAEERMQELEKSLLQPSGIPYECLVMPGPAMSNINQTVEKHDIDLVVMATHEAGALERLLGDLTAYALEKCKAPLLLVPEHAVFEPIRKIAFATDLKKIVRTAVFDKLKFLAHTFKAHIIILNVNTDLKDLTEEETEELNHIKQELQGMEYHFQFIEGEDAEEAILNYVENQQIQLVAAVPRHHGFFESLFRSSVTKKLALHSKVPLLAIHE